MVVVSYSGKEINAKLVYYGPGLSGKTTNLEFIYDSVPSTHRGKMVSMKTRTERTLFFDFLPVDLGEMGGFKTRFLLYTVPGQVYYNATRKLVLRGVDAVVFVADSDRSKMNENLESLENLRENLREYGMELDDMPWVLQYNKRDLPEVFTVEEMNKAMNPTNVPAFEAVATNGTGVFETFKGISKLMLDKLSKEVKTGPRISTSAMEAAQSAAGGPVARGATAAKSSTDGPKPAATSPEAARPAAPKPATPAAPKPATPKSETPKPQKAATSPAGRSKSFPKSAPKETPTPGPGRRAEDCSPAPAPMPAMSASSEPEKVSFGQKIARLFKKSPAEPEFQADPPMAAPEPQHPVAQAPQLSRVELPPKDSDSTEGPMEKTIHVPVPVRLSAEEARRGVVLKMTLEVELGAESTDRKKTGTG